jgi:hypothetical protein
MERRIAWVLNFDAEEELASPAARKTASAAMTARFASLAERAVGLVASDDLVIGDGVDARGCVGRAWCPTPSALARMARAGAEGPRAPSLEILRRANDRALCASLGQTLPDAAVATSRAEVERLVSRGSRDWLMKRAFGFAGRGRRKVHPGALTDADARWVDASFREGALQIEPWVDRLADFALHGHLDERGSLRLGAPTTQRCDAYGAWQSSELARDDELSADEASALAREATAAANALRAIGYFGPFGVDAYRWCDPEASATRFNPRSEINARYSMGWGIGMAGSRP